MEKQGAIKRRKIYQLRGRRRLPWSSWRPRWNPASAHLSALSTRIHHKIFNLYPNGIAYLKSKEVIVQTQPVKSIAQFLNQRIRWASKADKYDDKRIFAVLLLVYFFNVWILVLGLGAVFFKFGYYFIALLAAKTIIELYFLYPVARFFNKRIILWWFPLAQPFHIIYTIIAGWLGKFGSYTWKERTVK